MAESLDRLKTALADRYTIERELGRGGMAVVYLAQDLKHERQVAVKVLRPELAAALGAERFLNEIRVTANLQHPHILPLHDSGDADGFLYYVMPYVEGESLREKLNREKQLPIEDALRITNQVADALGSAHRQGVVHRDIKPENILLREGHALVADFGIALAVSSAGGERLTETGLSLGTPSYMSPEQVAGDREIDGRSDIYSLACVLYEMLAGDPPFTGPNAQAVLARHMTDPVPPITTVRSSVPSPVATAITKALGKAPADRFETAETFSKALAAETKEAETDVKSIVVLPFANLSPDPENEFFTDGLTDEIIADLSLVRSLRVISRTSAMQLKGTQKDLRTICRELGVQYVLEGSVRRAGRDLRIIAQLIDAERDTHLWAEKYSGSVDDVFEIQEKISRTIVDALKVTLSPEEDSKLALRPIDDARAHDAYLRARFEAWSFSEEALKKAQRHIENALVIVGDNELLYATLGHIYTSYMQAGVGDAADLISKAKGCAERVWAISPDSQRGYRLRGMVRFMGGDVRGSAPDLERACELNPQDPDTLLMLGYQRTMVGQLREANSLFDRLLEIDPLTSINYAMLGFVALIEGRAADAVPYYAKMHEIDPRSPFNRWGYAWSLLWCRRVEEAAAIVEPLVAEFPAALFSVIAKSGLLGVRGEQGRAADALTDTLRAAGRINELFSRELVHCCAMAGLVDEAIEWVENTYRIGNVNYPFWAKHNWFIDSLRGNPRFERVLDDMEREWAERTGEQVGSVERRVGAAQDQGGLPGEPTDEPDGLNK